MSVITFSTNHLRTVFEDADKYNGFKRLVHDLAHGNELFDYDENGNKIAISETEANKAVTKVLLEICELDEESLRSPKKRKRAIAKHKDELFEVLEEEFEFLVNTGLHDSEWFNQLVEERNLNDGDINEFYSYQDIIFAVAEVAGDNHFLTIQSLNRGKTTRVELQNLAVKTGKDIDLILTGRINFTVWCDHVAQAFIKKIQSMVFNAVMGAASANPMTSQFVKTGPLTAGTKATFDTLIEDVATANESEVTIMGTKSALRQLSNLVDLNWIATSQKESVAGTGMIGSYEGIRFVEIPQRFELNDTTKKIMPTDRLWIMPTTTDKFVKMVNRGEIEILEQGQNKGDLSDDFQTYEIQREMGIGVMLGRYFGQWTIGTASGPVGP